MEMLPPVGRADVATKRDLDALEQRMELRFEALDRRFEMVDQRFGALDQRFEATENKLLAGFRGELLAAVTAQSNLITAQTRTLLIANLGTVVSLAALAFGVAQLT